MSSEVRSWKKVYLGDLESLISEFKDALDKPAVVILSGVVGAGKTSFVQTFLGGKKAVSPSYGLVHEMGKIAHADFYRLKSPEEVVHLELPLYLEEKELFFIEWGIDFLSALRREVGDDFHFYELKIELNQASGGDTSGPSRNYTLLRHNYI